MSLVFNMLSMFVIVFLPRSKCLNLMAAITIHGDFGVRENKICPFFHFFPFHLPWSDNEGCCYHNVFNVEFQASFFSPLSPSSRGSSSLSAIKEISSAYLKLLIFLLEILIPVGESSSLAFCMMYSACKLNKQGDIHSHVILPKFEPVHCSTKGSNCCFLTCIQISQEAGKVVWYSHLFKIFSQFVVIHICCDPHSQRLWHISEAEVFLESPFLMIHMDHVLLKPHLKDFEHYLASMWNECKCMVVWTFFGIAFLWYWNENWPFPVLWPWLSFLNLLVYWMKHYHNIIF